MGSLIHGKTAFILRQGPVILCHQAISSHVDPCLSWAQDSNDLYHFNWEEWSKAVKLPWIFLGPVSIANKTSYREISLSSVEIIVLLWNLTGTLAAQISEQSENSKYKSCCFETLRDPTIRRLVGYWNEVQDAPLTFNGAPRNIQGNLDRYVMWYKKNNSMRYIASNLFGT